MGERRYAWVKKAVVRFGTPILGVTPVKGAGQSAYMNIMKFTAEGTDLLFEIKQRVASLWERKQRDPAHPPRTLPNTVLSHFPSCSVALSLSSFSLSASLPHFKLL